MGDTWQKAGYQNPAGAFGAWRARILGGNMQARGGRLRAGCNVIYIACDRLDSPPTCLHPHTPGLWCTCGYSVPYHHTCIVDNDVQLVVDTLVLFKVDKFVQLSRVGDPLG